MSFREFLDQIEKIMISNFTKIWNGENLTILDVETNTPYTLYMYKEILDRKFDQTFSHEMEDYKN